MSHGSSHTGLVVALLLLAAAPACARDGSLDDTTLSATLAVLEQEAAVAVTVLTEGEIALKPGEPIIFTYAVQNRGSEPLDVLGLALLSTTVRNSAGEGVIGVAGHCGFGWKADGSPEAIDPCPAGEPPGEVEVGERLETIVSLYSPVVEGSARAGIYEFSLPVRRGADDVAVACAITLQ